MTIPKTTLDIHIENVDLAQARAIEHMLAAWVVLGNMGSSRAVSFYADGDGNFHPEITVNGQTPKLSQVPSLHRAYNFNLGTDGDIIDQDDFYQYDDTNIKCIGVKPYLEE